MSPKKIVGRYVEDEPLVSKAVCHVLKDATGIAWTTYATVEDFKEDALSSDVEAVVLVTDGDIANHHWPEVIEHALRSWGPDKLRGTVLLISGMEATAPDVISAFRDRGVEVVFLPKPVDAKPIMAWWATTKAKFGL